MEENNEILLNYTETNFTQEEQPLLAKQSQVQTKIDYKHYFT